MLGTLGWQELLIILVILALLFGATRVRDLGGALGSGIREFRQQARGGDDEDEDEEKAETADAAAPASSDGEKPSDSSG